MKLYNTSSRQIEEFKPLIPPNIGLYVCGPTVYDYTHIGHMRTYANIDLLRRTLIFFGYKVKEVMNTTDVGHLSGDDDSGEDKLEKGSKKAGKTVWEVAKFFTDYFFKTTDSLNIERPDIVAPATKHIEEMISLIKKLQEKGFTYETKEAIYFDISKFAPYGKLSGQKLDEKIKGARVEVNSDPDKKHPADFALWFKRVGRFADHTMHWPSPWGEGFPGWHIECSAMSMKYLGETLDIHTGGIDHIPVHHENEIAQSEAATGKTFVRYWFHNNFLMVEGQKMSKSLGNFYTLEDLVKHNIDPMSVRYLFLQSHYRQVTNFTWESAKAAQDGFSKLKNIVIDLKKIPKSQDTIDKSDDEADKFKEKFKSEVGDDLQIPQALATTWEMLKSEISPQNKLNLIFYFDRIFGLNLDKVVEEVFPEQIVKLAEQRKMARQNKNFKASDDLRTQIEKLGYKIEDDGTNYKIKKS